MPGTTEFNPNDPEQMKAAAHEIKDRRTMINGNRQYYRGDMPKPLEDDRDNVIINLCRDVVDQTVAFLFPEMPEVMLDDDLDRSDEERLIADTFDANGAAVELANIAVNGALAGQVYVRVRPPEPAVTGHPYAQLFNLDPANVVTWWDSDNHKRLWGYELRWGGSSDPTKNQQENRQIIRRVGAGWEVVDYVGKDERWREVGRELWAYPLPPVVSVAHLPRPNKYYGQNEIPHKWLNDAVNAVASDMKSILRWHASPTMFGRGFNAQGLEETSVDGLYTVENTDADLKTVEMMSDLAPSMNFLMKLEQTFFRQARVVVLPSDLAAFRNVTNLGIRAAFMPQIAKNETLRRSYGTLIERLARVVLMLAGRDFNIQPTIQWGSALPMDETEEVDLIQRELAMGILSKRMAAQRRGRDYDAVTADIMREQLLDGVMVEGQPVGVST